MSQRRSARPPIHLVVPGPIKTLTGGFIYDRHMADALRRAERLGDLVCLDGDYPHPDDDALDNAARRLATIENGGPLVIDGLALTALLERGTVIPTGRTVIALVHHPLCDETGLSPRDVDILLRAERQALKRAIGCIVTSPTTLRRLEDFGVTRDRARVVVPGLNQTAAPERPSQISGGPVRVLCVATLSPRKGQDLLLQALAALQELDWRLDLVGAPRDPVFADRIHAMVAALALGERVRFHGEVDGALLDAHYRDADIFALASHHEGFGMALAEAMAHGLPIISTRAGAIPETVPNDAGDLVAPGDVAALTTSLRRLIRDPMARSKTGAAARRAAARMPSWAESGTDFIAAVDGLLALDAPSVSSNAAAAP